jgi:triacylglycerol esterase/lipase EstA (alpha/beta hydrolase family)
VTGTVAAVAVLAVTGLLGAAGPAAADVLAGPDGGIGTYAAALVLSLPAPDTPPPGANDWACRPSAAHPRPVVLVNGTWANGFANFNALAPYLAARGYCVFDPNIDGDIPHFVLRTNGDIRRMARDLGRYVDTVLAKTGAAQVVLVGHSLGGGALSRAYLKWFGGAGKVRSLIGINPSNHGSLVANVLAPLSPVLGTAIRQQALGSELNRELDADGDTVPGVRYTVIASRIDEVLVPSANSFLTAGPGATVDNVAIQDVCPVDLSEHLASPYDVVVFELVRNALDPEHAEPVRCRISLPVLGNLPGDD